MQTMPAFLGNEGGVFIGHWISLNREQEMSILGNRTSTVVIPSRADGEGSHNGAFDHAKYFVCRHELCVVLRFAQDDIAA